MRKLLCVLLFVPMMSQAYEISDEYSDFERCEIYVMSLDTIASNLANVDTTRTPEGGPYRALYPHFDEDGFFQVLESHQVWREYEPEHPDANEYGLVDYPAINLEDQIRQFVGWRRMYDRDGCG